MHCNDGVNRFFRRLFELSAFEITRKKALSVKTFMSKASGSGSAVRYDDHNSVQSNSILKARTNGIMMDVKVKLLVVFLKLISALKCDDSFESEDLRRREPGFIFTYPKTLLAGKNETVCLALFDAVLPTKVLLDLKIKDKHYLSAHTAESEYSCLNLQVPEHKAREPVGTSLHLQLQLNGSVHSAHNQETILMYPRKDVTFVETDRSFYKPGETVRMRVLVLKHDLKPYLNHTHALTVKVFNPTGITVAVWKDVQTELGLVQLDFQLTEDTVLGKWRVEANDIFKYFHVKRYVLPRFKVSLLHPRVVFNKAENVTFSVCAKYAYGKAVKGIALIKISYPDMVLDSVNKIKKLENGCSTFAFTNGELHLESFNYRSIHIVSTVTEQDTNKIEIDSGKMRVTGSPYSIEFSVDHPHFQPGLPYKGALKISDVHTPIKYEEEHAEICFNIAIKRAWNIKQQYCKNFTYDSNGEIQFSLLPPKDNVVLINLYARSLHHADREISVSLLLHRWASTSNTYIYIEKMSKAVKCGQPVQFLVHYTSDKFRPNENVTFHYLVKSRNEIVDVGRFIHTPKRQSLNLSELKNVVGVVNKFTLTENRVDKFILKLNLGKEVISKSQLIVYFTLNKEIIAANTFILVEKCLYNKVNARWTEPQLYPGELANLNIQTGPHSLCAVSSVDKSSTFLMTSKSLNIHQVLSPFLQERSAKPSYKPNCLAYHRRRPENYTEDKFWDLRRRKRYYGMLGSDDFDAFEVFSSVGVGVITNLRLLTKQCVQRGPLSHFKDIVLALPVGLAYGEQYEDGGAPVRSFFPETWLWELVPVGETGKTNVARYLPHTITSWITNTACVSPADGVGIAVTTELNTFKPFFLDILLPYSIKRGEVLHMTVVLFNYMNHSLPIRVTLGDAQNLALADALDARRVTFCVAGGDSSTHIYRVKGIGLGVMNVSVLAEIESSYPGECGPEVIVNRRDVMYKSVLVEAEGYPSEFIRSTFLCANNTMSNNNITWNLALPKDVVPDSATGRVLLNADLLGPTIQNLESLLTVPTGCGEQIMATMAPNLYVLRYLKANNKLTPFAYQRAVRNLKIGYQRILDYVHSDGSFSAFGYHDPSGSMFLTAFVVRTLRQAKKYIYVDDKVINKAVVWITDNQLENGCFAAVSHVFQDMGGTSTENSTAALTSYVLISLLESNIPLTETVRTNAKYCIRGHYQADKYTLAISTYALYLVDWYTEADRCLQRLLEAAMRENNLMWWSHPGLSTSIGIEMTSYVLMSLLHRNTTENLIHASSVVRWLATQRGPQGGFSTSQDTAVALDAISKYANILKNKEPVLNVTVSTYKQNSYLQIKRDDWLKTTQQKLNDIPTKVKVTVAGDGCTLVQVIVSYNLKHLNSSEAFKLAVDVEPMSTIDRCSMAMISPCMSYTGPGMQSNMAVMEVTMPSGYEPDRASLYQLTSEANTKVKRFEELKNRVVLYFTQLSNEPVCIQFSINENVFVENLINTTITLYDYYKPELSITKSYKVNTCQPNEIAPVPPLPAVEENRNKTLLLDDIATPEICTHPSTKVASETQISFKKRSAEDNELNSDFIDLDIELATPDGIEGNVPVYITPDPTYHHVASDVN